MNGYEVELRRLIRRADEEAARFDFTEAVLMGWRAGYVARGLGHDSLTRLAKLAGRDPVRDVLIENHEPVTTKGSGT